MSDTHLQNIIVTYPATRVRTRGYLGDLPGLKRAVEARMVVATWNPSIDVAIYTDGQDESSAVRTITKDRTRFTRPFDRSAYDETNASGDALDPYREDYSVLVPSGGIDLGAGVLVDAHQVSNETLPVKARGNWFVVELNVTQGRMKLQRSEVDGLVQFEPRQKSYT